nr:Druantia anti-phage system protein DruA [uncultured Desulfobacter sp.]
MPALIQPIKFCGRDFSTYDLLVITEVVATCDGISRTEMAYTVCEILDWKRPSGKLKARECKDLLELLDDRGILNLPEKKQPGNHTPQKLKKQVTDNEPYCTLSGSVEEFTPLNIQRVRDKSQRNLFRDLISRYHYLGYAMPFGARLQYLISVTRPKHQVVGCIQFSSPAWRMKSRDLWIGWDDDRRSKALQHVVNNSRFLVLAPIRNLASSMLSASLDHLRFDWERQYGVAPLLLETLVDRSLYYGGCYRAANWIKIGETTGRGRMDKTNRQNEAEVKTIMVYPLVKNARRRLREGNKEGNVAAENLFKSQITGQSGQHNVWSSWTPIKKGEAMMNHPELPNLEKTNEFSLELKLFLNDTRSNLKGSERRKFMANVVRLMGKGGQRRAEKELGWDRKTIQKGTKELDSGFDCIDNFSGRGRKPVEEKLPNLLDDIKDIIEPTSQCDPTFRTTQLYSPLTGVEVLRRLREDKKYSPEQLPTVQTIRYKLNQLGYRLKKVAKTNPQKK